MKINHFILILLMAGCSFAFDRNYYGDELQFSNPCLPKNINFGQPGNDPNGPSWFEAQLNCTDKAILKTKWGIILATNITFYTLDNGRLDQLIYSNRSIQLPSIQTTRFKESDAMEYATGMIPILANALDGRIFWKQENNCLTTDNRYVQNITSKGINAYHYRFPYVHVAETEKNINISSSLENFPAHSLNTSALISAGKMNSSCYDIRMLNSSEDGALPFEIENSTCNSAAYNTTIWVNLLSTNATGRWCFEKP